MNDMPTWTPTMPEATPLADLPRAHTMFLDLLGQLRVGAEERADLTAMLREPWRRYHGAGHAGLLWDRHLAHGGDRSDAVAAHAIAYHDAVYVVGASDNEARSAALWQAHAEGLPARLREAVTRAILATADHAATHTDPDAAWLVDLDLTPLGEPWAHFEASSRALREEAGQPIDRPSAGQIAFLRRLLTLPRLYRSERHRAALWRAYEAPARANLRRVLDGIRP